MNTLNKNSYLLFCLLFCCFLCSKGNLSFYVEDENGKLKNLASLNENLIIICFHYFNCKECFKIINILKEKFPNYKICFLVRTSKNERYLKEKVKYDLKRLLGNLYQKNYPVFFDVHFEEDPWPPNDLKGGIFGKYKINKTPAYFIITKDTLLFVPYEKIEKELYK